MELSNTCRVATLNDSSKTVKILEEFFYAAPVSMIFQFDSEFVKTLVEKALVDPKNWIVILSFDGPKTVGVIAGRIEGTPWSREKAGIEMAWYVQPDVKDHDRRTVELLQAFKAWAKTAGASHVYYGRMAAKEKIKSTPTKLKSVEELHIEVI